MIFVSEILERVAKNAPLTVMAKAILENVFNPDQLNPVLQKVAGQQRQRKILFSFLVNIMLLVACKIRPAVHAAYKALGPQAFTVDAVYDKLQGIEIPLSEMLLEHTAEKIRLLLAEIKAPFPEPIPGFRTIIVDGNKIAPTDRRLKPLREQDAAPMPGFAIVLFEPACHLITHATLCRDAYTQERALIPQVVERAIANDLWVADRNFCCWNFIHGVISRNAFVLVRQHASSIRWIATSELKHAGRTATGEVWEQSGYVENVETLERIELRRIEVRLDKPTRDKEQVIGILTNLPATVTALQIADSYLQRWKIETAFQEVESLLSGEISTLGYPEAALFSLASAFVSYNVLQCISQTIKASQPESELEVSLYYVADEVAHTLRGLEICTKDEDWEKYRVMTLSELGAELLRLGRLVPIGKFSKRRRRRVTSDRKPLSRNNHASTARLIAEKSG